MRTQFTEMPSEQPLGFQFHTGETYFDTVASAIDAATSDELVTMTTMGFDPLEPKVKRVTDALVHAAQRGVVTALGIDTFAELDKKSVGSIGTVPTRGFTKANEHYALLQDLRNTGSDALNMVDFVNINYPTTTHMPVYTGRSHIKSAVVGDKIFAGGISLDATDRLDAMVSFTHPEAALWIAKFSRMSIIKSSVKKTLDGHDQVINLTEKGESKLLIDAGVRGQSVIFDEALNIIDSSEEKLIYASEQFPNAKIGKHLLQAYNRGVDVVIAVNHPSKHDRYRSIHKAILDRAKKYYPADFFAHELPIDFPTLHTKAVASEARATMGSHNLNRIGVRLGTAEMNISSSNPEFVAGVGNLVLRQIEHGVDA